MKPSLSVARVLKRQTVSRTAFPSQHHFVLKLCRRQLYRFQKESLVSRFPTRRWFHSSWMRALDVKNSSAPSELPTLLENGSLADPARPDLFYHLLQVPNATTSSSSVYAVSFLPTSPATPNAPEVIGWLPAEADGAAEAAGLDDFRENPAFRAALHQAIKEGLDQGVDEVQINGAIQTHQGWMHIHDERNIPALGRIGDPDDIIASVLVEDGKIIAGTYQAMPAYRLCTSDGVTKLTPGLAQKLTGALLASRL